MKQPGFESRIISHCPGLASWLIGIMVGTTDKKPVLPDIAAKINHCL
jgi:hypothetical protein